MKGDLGGGGGKGRNLSHQIAPHTNRLLSTLSEPITYTNSCPRARLCSFVCLCVAVVPSLRLLGQLKRVCCATCSFFFVLYLLFSC